MEYVIALGQVMLTVFSKVIEFLSVEVSLPWMDAEFWQDIQNGVLGPIVEKIPGISSLVEWLALNMPDLPNISLLGLMVGYGLFVYIFFVFVKFILDIVL